MRTWTRLVATLGLSLAAAGIAPTTAHASSVEPGRAQISAALDRIANKTYTSQDIALIRSVPEVARQVPDPRESADSIGSTVGRSLTADAAAAPAASGCWWITSWVRKPDIFGTTIFKMWSHTEWCGNGRVVTRIYDRNGWFTNVDSGVYFRKWVNNSVSGVGNYTGHSDREALMEYCVVKIGCYATAYPYINQTFRGDGSWSVSSSGG